MRLQRNALLGLASPFDEAQDDRLCYSVKIVLTKSERLPRNEQQVSGTWQKSTDY